MNRSKWMKIGKAQQISFGLVIIEDFLFLLYLKYRWPLEEVIYPSTTKKKMIVKVDIRYNTIYSSHKQ